MPDAPLRDRSDQPMYLTDAFVAAGTRFTVLAFANGASTDVPDDVSVISIGDGGFADPAGLLAARYEAAPGSAYLLRPDGYVAARFRHPTRAALEAALARASALN